MQPALLVTAHPAKKARKRKPEAGKAAMKKALDKERSRTKSTSVWRLRGGDNWGLKGLKSDAEVALFLLDR